MIESIKTKIGYISDIKLKAVDIRYSTTIDYLVNESKEKDLNYLIICGGISNDYMITLKFITDLVRTMALKGSKTQVKFIVGNTDFYYKERVVNKKDKFDEIHRLYLKNRYYLPTNPIILQDIQVFGAETWYDYTLYRGNGVDLDKVTKKQLWFKKNKDVEYITDRNDYMLGLENTFDRAYCRECMNRLSRDISYYRQRMAKPRHRIVIGYFYPSKIFLSNGYFEKYFGTFKGTEQLMSVLIGNDVTDYIIGLDTERKEITFKGIRFKNSANKKILIQEY